MALTVITTSGLISGTAHSFAADGDELYVPEGIYWGSSNGALWSTPLNSISVTLAGQAITAAGITTQTGDGFSLTITETGSLISFADSPSITVLYFNGGTGAEQTLVNHGLISIEKGTAIVSSGGTTVTNTGQISAASPIFFFNGSGDYLVNSGTIAANAYDDANQDDRFNNAVIVENTDSRVTNLAGGVLSAVGTEAAGLRVAGSADGTVIINAGEITSANGWGVDISNVVVAPTFVVNNSGIISGDEGALRGHDGGIDRVNNSGQMLGNVDLRGGNDKLFNTGQILGFVYLGDGSDVYNGKGGLVTETVTGGADNDTLIGGSQGDYFIGSAGRDLLLGNEGNDTLYGADSTASDATADIIRGGAGDDQILGAAGNDTLIGGDDNDTVNGAAGNDLIIGNAGDDSLTGYLGEDTILGGAGNDEIDAGDNNDTVNANAGDDTIDGAGGNDLLIGQDGRDLMEGGAGLDTMDGGNGDDVLEGGADNDILRGRAGEDELAGGLGRDFLTGGQDADVFVFRALAETVVGANRDQILDFEQGVDLITVAGLSPGVFEFRGTAGFAPSGNPELRLFETPTGSTIVQLDADGDGTQDAEIRVANVTGLTAEDFVL
ncbi:hypothetical protein KZZ07_10505 [Mameliella sp. CS4]|uniref:calcium-binding protein n=1 Tax=Mameliella sp. CS4 TaxID=2862329 RepID=UPI001C5F7C3F|nr:calcium-binding protein [Mameliella sp. CS4]MBW4982972.1 hypothetical protein [Mameliella sp. CS4]